jgi:hypothetical protein
MKALKFCHDHRVWDDTVGETDCGDALYELLKDKECVFTQWWDRIDYNYK